LLFAAGLAAGCETLPEPPDYHAPSASAQRPQVVSNLQGSHHEVRQGETLWRIAHSYGLDAKQLAAANRLSMESGVRVGQRLFIPLPPESRHFLWPIRGTIGRSGSSSVDIRGPAGGLVRASRTGRVAIAAHRLSGWGKTVVLDHYDGHFSVYAGLGEILVSPSATVRQGMPIGNLGAAPLHFEIRYGHTPRNTLALLPGE
jgi:lipoprotein NlpD